jgi:hypothetical protein
MNQTCPQCGESLNEAGRCVNCRKENTTGPPPILSPLAPPLPINAPPVLYSRLTVSFDPVVMLIGGFSLWINECKVHESHFNTGFDLFFELPLGIHQVKTKIEVLTVSRSQTTPVHLGPNGARVVLSYNRLFGNFDQGKVEYL